MFDRRPTLRGKLVEARPLGLEDFAGLYGVAADPQIWEQHRDPEGRIVYRIAASAFERS